jgi:hypothetical protein
LPGRPARPSNPVSAPERAPTLDAMWSKRQTVDYALQRRHALERLRSRVRTLSREDVCDADPMLIRSALHHGELSAVRCPIGNCGRLVNLSYTFGEQLGQYSGRIKSPAELEEMENEFGEFRVCVVEVCTECGWNHMITSYLLGDGVKRRPPRRQRTVEDIYG